MRRLLVLDVSVRLLYPSIMVLSLYFLFSGHNQPGGGFVGGLTAAAGLSLRYVAGGIEPVRRAFRLPGHVILGSGLAISVATAIVPLALGHSVLEHATFKAHPPLLGEVKATSALPFDIGVYLVVLGLVLMIFEAFGEDLEEEIEMIEGPAMPATSTLAAYQGFVEHDFDRLPDDAVSGDSMPDEGGGAEHDASTGGDRS